MEDFGGGGLVKHHKLMVVVEVVFHNASNKLRERYYNISKYKIAYKNRSQNAESVVID
jgi:hypothetical protein